jgi:hypothetical protein
MIRQRLQNRRECESFEFRHAGLDFTSPIEAIARDAAVTVSIALQFGADLQTIRAALALAEAP